MGILVKFFIEDSKDRLNVVVEEFDNQTQTCQKTMLDVMVPLVTKREHVSDIDECTNDDLIIDSNNDDCNWTRTNDDLVRVLGDELGIEISNVTGNATPRKEISNEKKSHEEKERKASAVEEETEVNSNEKQNLPNVEENMVVEEETPLEQVLDDSSAANQLSSEECNNVNENMKEADEVGATLVVTLDSAEADDDIREITSEELRNDEPEVQDDSIVVDVGLEDVDQPSRTVEVTQASKSDEASLSAAKIPENSESNDNPSDNEEIMDVCFEEVDRWSLGDESNASGARVVDLTEDRENIDPRSVNNISNEEDVNNEQDVVVNDISDDEDEVSSRHSCPRSSFSCDPENVEITTVYDDADFPHGPGSNPRERDVIETIHDEDANETISEDDERVPQVVDLTGEKKVVCIDLTNEKKPNVAANNSSPPQVIRRSMTEVMNDIRDFYSANKDVIVENQKMLAAFGAKLSNKGGGGGIRAPPKLNNCLDCGGGGERRKRTASEGHESQNSRKMSRRPSGLRLRNESADRGGCSGGGSGGLNSSPKPVVKSLMKAPPQIRGPDGYRVNDDLGALTETWDDDDEYVVNGGDVGGCRGDDARYNDAEQASDSFDHPIPSLLNRRDDRRPRSASGAGWNRSANVCRSGFPHLQRPPRKRYPWRQNLSGRYNHVSPLKRLHCEPRPARLRPTARRGEVWIQ